MGALSGPDNQSSWLPQLFLITTPRFWEETRNGKWICWQWLSEATCCKIFWGSVFSSLWLPWVLTWGAAAGVQLCCGPFSSFRFTCSALTISSAPKVYNHHLSMLGGSKSLFGFLCKIRWKNLKELFGQSNTYHLNMYFYSWPFSGVSEPYFKLFGGHTYLIFIF